MTMFPLTLASSDAAVTVRRPGCFEWIAVNPVWRGTARD